MVEKGEQREIPENNRISNETVQRVLSKLSGDPRADFQLLQDGGLSDLPYSDIFTMNFQVWRMGDLGWQIPILDEDREKHSIIEESLTSNGPDIIYETDSQELPEEDLAGIEDFFTGTNFMRAFIANCFLEHAKQTNAKVVFNNSMVDVVPVAKHRLTEISATRKGFYVYDKEETQEQWEKDNPHLYNAVDKQTVNLAKRFTPLTLRMYKHFPQTLLDSISPKVEDVWNERLMEYALRAYTWFSPAPPKLIEVPVRKRESV